MPTTLTTIATDGSTYVVTAEFRDAAGSATVPTTIEWTLTDDVGNTINSRASILASLTATLPIVLSGNDLKYSDGKRRIVYIYALYDSTEGTNLPLRDEVHFPIVNLLNLA